jgi:ferredoxin
LSWSTLPDAWADRLTIIVLFLSFYFIFRRMMVAELRREARLSDFSLPLIVILPFLSGYLLAHGTLDHLAFFKKNLWTLHVISGEIALFTVVFLIVRNRIQTAKCTGCAACSISCPTGALFYTDGDTLRAFTSDDSRCIHCGACVRDCPEYAAEIKHQISLGAFFGRRFSQDIRQLDLQECILCRDSIAPRLQYNKITETIEDLFVHVCPRCRRQQLMRILVCGDPPLLSKKCEQADVSQPVSGRAFLL